MLAGQDDFKTLRPNWIRRSDGFLLIFSVTERLSLQNLEAFHKDIMRVKPNTPIVVVANKKDLPKREISFEEGKNFASTINAEYLEVSAKTGDGVVSIFTKVVESLLQANASSHGSNTETGCCYIF